MEHTFWRAHHASGDRFVKDKLSCSGKEKSVNSVTRYVMWKILSRSLLGMTTFFSSKSELVWANHKWHLMLISFFISRLEVELSLRTIEYQFWNDQYHWQQYYVTTKLSISIALRSAEAVSRRKGKVKDLWRECFFFFPHENMEKISLSKKLQRIRRARWGGSPRISTADLSSDID